jgi:hypothetical protein
MTTNKPSKESVRIYTQQRNAAQRSADRPAPPTPAEIRRQLGWTLIVVARAAERGQDITDEFR